MHATIFDGDLPHELIRLLRKSDRVAVDTETSGLNWATDSLDICQMYTEEVGPVIVRRVSSRPSNLATVLEDPRVTKVFHFAPFDLRFLEAKWSIRTRSVACTKAASRLIEPLWPKESHSLKSLLDHYLGFKISKGAVRTSDWAATSLTAEQIDYASEDVAHLLELYGELSSRVSLLNLETLLAQIFEYMPVDAHLEVSRIPNPLAY